MDPITAFAAAQAAVAGVKAAVNLYKEAKSVGSDVGSIAHEISHGLGKFFEAQEAVCKAGQEIEGKVIKTKSVDVQAFENVMRVRQLQQYEQELKELLIYHTPMAGLWEDFQLKAVLQGQATDNALVDSEQFSVGVLNTVRGYY
jgi:HEPN domain-containing protein